MRNFTTKTHIGRVFRVLLKTVDSRTFAWNGEVKWYPDFNGRGGRDATKLNARLEELRNECGPRYGFRVRDIDDYRDNCSGHYLEVVEPEKFRLFLQLVRQQDAARGLPSDIPDIPHLGTSSAVQGALL